MKPGLRIPSEEAELKLFPAFVVAATAALAACSAHAPGRDLPEGIEEPEQLPAPGVAAKNPAEEVPLEVEVSDQEISGRVLRLRAKVTNPYALPVHGLRLQLAIGLPLSTDRLKVMEIQQKELDATIESGQSIAFGWDVESVYLGAGALFVLAAYPRSLGGQNLPPPDHWRED